MSESVVGPEDVGDKGDTMLGVMLLLVTFIVGVLVGALGAMVVL